MGAKAEIFYKPRGPDWLTPKQFRTAALVYGIIAGLISSALIIDMNPQPVQPAHINTVNDPVGK